MQVKKQQLEPNMEQRTDFQIRKAVCQGCILSPCLFNSYAEHIMQNAWLDEAQAGIRIAERNINPKEVKKGECGEKTFREQKGQSMEKAMAPHSSTLTWKIP